MKTFDAGHAQDLFHYALAMMGDSSSSFPCGTLKQRLEACEQAAWIIEHLEKPTDWQRWDNRTPRADMMRSETDLKRVGEGLLDEVKKWADENDIDPRTGEKNANTK